MLVAEWQARRTEELGGGESEGVCGECWTSITVVRVEWLGAVEGWEGPIERTHGSGGVILASYQEKL